MSKFVVEGSNRLCGSIAVQGAKNSSLPILAATIICRDICVLHNCPNLSDVNTSIKILRYLGAEVIRDGTTLTVNTKDICRCDIPDELMREMRSSIVFLGAIVSRMGMAKLSLPGGCELGPRPIDLHLKSLRLLGVEISEHYGVLDCDVPNGIEGTRIALSFPSVGATENLMLCAAMAKGTTVISNAAREPEICDLADFLNACGAKISGAGEGTIYIDGVEKLCGCQHSIIPDRIVAATYMAAAAVTRGSVELKNIIPAHLSALIPVMEEVGCSVIINGNSLFLKAPDRLNPVKYIRTMPYPGFPTDAQPPVMAMTCIANGTSMFAENIFESRYKHVGELLRLGANIKVEGKVAVVEGVKRLYGARVEALDLRGGAALTVAALAAQGTTEIGGIKYIERGYEDLELNLSSAGALIKKL